MNRLDLSVRQRLAIGSVLIAVLIALMGAIVAKSVANIRELQQSQAELIEPRVYAAAALENATYEQAIAFRNYVLTRTATDLDAFRRAYRALDERLAHLSQIPKTPDGDRLFAPIPQRIAEHRREIDRFLQLAETGAPREALHAQEARVSARRAATLAQLQAFSAVQQRQNQAVEASIRAATDRLLWTVIVATLLVAVVSFLTSMVIARAVRQPAAQIASAAAAIERGSFAEALALERPSATQATFNDELREAGRVFGNMASALRARELRLEAHSRFSASLGKSLDAQRLASDALCELGAYVGAVAGIVYLLGDDDGTLQPLAAYGLGGEAMRLAAGSGIPGQAATNQRTCIVRDIPSDSPFTIHFGFDAIPPRTVVATPMMLEKKVLGVVLLASVGDLASEAMTFVEQGAGQLAITLGNALGHARIGELAKALQASNERLQVQNEELQVQSEELQAQTEELHCQNEELQAQSEELNSQTEELQRQAEELRSQREALTEANRGLLDSEEQKNRFLATLAHELRNPLAAIRGAIDLMPERADATPLNDVVRRQTRHLTRLVDDLLDVARVETGKIVLSRQPVDLATIAQRCVASMRTNGSAEPSAPISVETKEPVWVDGDETRLEQIVTNLLSNAVKCTPPSGTIRLTIGRDGDAARLTVSDTGVGIAPELLPRIFDFLVQGASASDKNGGLGIGLTLVKNLVQLHGGTVNAASDGPGRGTTVTVRLPAIEAPVAATSAETNRTPRLPIKRSVVLVEDNPEVRLVMSLLLKKAGHDVFEADDGPSAVDAVTSRLPEVALIDLGLPGFDGWEVARRIRAHDPSRTVKLIALSGFGREEDRARALEAGFDDHLVKPVDFERLTRVLSDARET